MSPPHWSITLEPQQSGVCAVCMILAISTTFGGELRSGEHPRNDLVMLLMDWTNPTELQSGERFGLASQCPSGGLVKLGTPGLITLDYIWHSSRA
ncbi:hypothetical protein N7523_001568 [Penicillium sp. IBT 18751x]|nr:hypothetical protein N7523_001568 [Penicillium sp. IBT 18751x]